MSRRFDEMREGLAVSAVLHTAIILVILLGLPDFLKKEPPPEETAVAVKLVNISELTRATQRNPKPVEKAPLDTPPPPVPTTKPEPPKPDPIPPPPSPPPSPSPPPPPPPPEPPKPSPPPPPPPPPPAPDPAPLPKPPEPKPEPPKPEPPKPEVKPDPPKPVVKPTPPVPPKPDKTKQQDLQVDDLLKNLAATKPSPQKQDTPAKPPKQTASAQASAQPNAPLGSQVTTSEKDAIVSQIEPCWNVDPGAKNAKSLVVTLAVEMAPDGTPQTVQIVDQGRYSSDKVFQSAADAAVRAMRNPKCVPLKMPAGKYEQWKSMRLNFDPKDLL